MPKLLTKIIAVVLIFAAILSLGWILLSNNRSNKEIPKRAKLVQNIKYDFIQGGITHR